MPGFVYCMYIICMYVYLLILHEIQVLLVLMFALEDQLVTQCYLWIQIYFLNELQSHCS